MADQTESPPQTNPVVLSFLPPLPRARDPRTGGPFVPTKKIKIQWVEDNSRRRACLKKRRSNIIKKAEELHQLCNVEVCAVIFSPQEAEPVVFPSVDRAAAMCARFAQQPHTARSHIARTHQQFLRELLEKKEKQVWEKKREIEEKETRALVYHLLEGGDITGLENEKLDEMKKMMERMYYEMLVNSGRIQPTVADGSSVPQEPRIGE